jgi:hypothetical protein
MQVYNRIVLRTFTITMKIRFLLLIAFSLLLLNSCGLFKKKCDCPDVRKSKRVASKAIENYSTAINEQV